MTDAPNAPRPRLGGVKQSSGESPASDVQTDPVKVRDAGPQTGTDTVTIGCKWPNGLVMRLYDMVDVETTVNGIVMKEKKAFLREGAKEFVLNGFSVDLGKLAGGIMPEHSIVGGFGLTFGIPRDFAEEWFTQNAKADVVRRGLIFMEGSEQSARAHAREFAGLQCGIQPIDPNDPAPRAGLRKGQILADKAA